jgi:pimeloyl-ACP methyl ester carboxylesterase
MTQTPPAHRVVSTPQLDIAYLECGPVDGDPVVLLHGYPYDASTYNQVAQQLAAAGFRTIAPYLRGFGPTRFRHADTPRTGDQAVLAADLLALVNALDLDRPILAGYDWGGRAACSAAALWPERFRGFVAMGGHSIYRVGDLNTPAPPPVEQVLWHLLYFQTERGRAGLEAYRREVGRSIWQSWSPAWPFDEAVFERTALSYDNPDFVDVVIHNYRHRFGLVPGDPDVADLARTLDAIPPVLIPTIVLHAGSLPLSGRASVDARLLPKLRATRTIAHSGHNMPQEAPTEVAEAVQQLRV